MNRARLKIILLALRALPADKKFDGVKIVPHLAGEVRLPLSRLREDFRAHGRAFAEATLGILKK